MLNVLIMKKQQLFRLLLVCFAVLLALPVEAQNVLNLYSTDEKGQLIRTYLPGNDIYFHLTDIPIEGDTIKDIVLTGYIHSISNNSIELIDFKQSDYYLLDNEFTGIKTEHFYHTAEFTRRVPLENIAAISSESKVRKTGEVIRNVGLGLMIVAPLICLNYPDMDEFNTATYKNTMGFGLSLAVLGFSMEKLFKHKRWQITPSTIYEPEPQIFREYGGRFEVGGQ